MQATLFLIVATTLTLCRAQLPVTNLWNAQYPPNFSVQAASTPFTSSSGAVVYFITDLATPVHHGKVVAVNGSTGDVIFSHSVTPKIGIQAQALFLEQLDGNTALIGCTNSIIFFDTLAGAVLSESELPPGVTITTENNYSSTPHHALVGNDALVLGVVAVADSQSGTTVFNRTTGQFVTLSAIAACDNTTSLAAVVPVSDKRAYLQVCDDGSTMLVNVETLMPVWSWANVSLEIVSVSQALPVVGSDGTTQSFLIALNSYSSATGEEVPYLMSISSGGKLTWLSRLRNKCKTPASFGAIMNIALASSGTASGPADVVVVLVVCQVTAFSIATGFSVWTSGLDFTFTATLFVDSRDMRGVYAMGSSTVTDTSGLVKFSARSGGVLCQGTMEAQFSQSVPPVIYFSAINKQALSVPLNSTKPQVEFGAPAILALFNYESSYAGIASFDTATCTNQIQFYFGNYMPSMPLLMIAGDEPAAAFFTSSYVGMILLSTGFAVAAGSTAMVQQDSVVFAASGTSISAVNQVGNVLWTQAVSGSQSASIAATTAGNFVLVPITPYSIAVTDSLTGTVINTITISSDCWENSTTTPTPTITGVATGLIGRDVYFTAGVSCLFHITPTRQMNQIATSALLTLVPVVDEDNGLALVASSNTLYAFSTSTDKLLWSYTNDIQGISYPIASSNFGDPAQFGRQFNRFIFLFSGTEVLCFDGPTGTILWSLALPGAPAMEQFATLFNHSLFVVTQAGLCRISTALSTPDAQRLMWCASVPAYNAELVSNIVITPTARIFVLIGEAFLAVFSGSTGKYLTNVSLAAAFPIVGESPECTSLTFNPDNYIIYALCNYAVVGVDAVSLRPAMSLYVSSPTSIAYFNSVLYALTSDPYMVVGQPTPTSLVGLNANPPPKPDPIGPPSVETPPPGYVPGTPVPTAPPVAAASTIASSPITLKTVEVPDGSTGFSFTSTAFPNLVFSTQEFLPQSSLCVPTARQASDLSLVWSGRTNVSDECTCSAPEGFITPNSVVVVICTGTISAYSYASGNQLWSTLSEQNQGFVGATFYIDPLNTTEPLVIASAPGNTTAFDLFKGTVRWTAANNFSQATSTVLYVPSPPGSAATVIVWEGADSSGVMGFDVITGKVVFAVFETDICVEAYFEVGVLSNSKSPVVSGLQSLYFGCVNGTTYEMGIYAVNVLSGGVTLQLALDISYDAVTTTLLLQESTTVYMPLEASIVAVDVVGKQVLWNTSFAAVNPSLELVASCGIYDTVLLCVGSNESENSIIVALNKATGSLMWNVSIPYSQYASGPIATAGFPSGEDWIMIGTVGAYLINYKTGTISWGSSTSSTGQSMISGFAIVAAASSIVVPAATSTVYSVVLLVSSSLAFSTRQCITTVPWVSFERPATLVTYYTSVKNGNFGSWILSGTTLGRFDGSGAPTFTLYLPRNSLVYPELLSVVTIASTVLQSNVSVLLVFYPSFIQMYEADTGSYIAAVDFVVQCPASTGTFSVSSPTSLGDYVFFQDTYCFYQVDVYAGKVKAVVVGSPNGIIVGTSALFSQDQSIAVVAVNGGTLLGIDTMRMAVLWYTDTVDRLVTYSSSEGFALLPSTPFRTLTAPGTGLSPLDESFIVSAPMYSFAFRFFNGDLLWLQKAPSMVVANVTTDGGLLVATTTNLTKFATNVNYTKGSRQLWTATIPDYVYYMTQLGQSNILIVVFYMQAIAFDITSGEKLWTYSFSSCNEAFPPVAVFDLGRSSEFPPMVGIGCYSLHILASATGKQVYVAIPDTEQNNQVGIFGPFIGAYAVSSAFTAIVEPLVFDQTLPLPPALAPASVTIPPNFNFVTPSPTTSPATTNPINVDFYSPLRTWNVPSQCSNCEVQTTGYFIMYQSQQAILGILPFYDYTTSTYNSTLTVNSVSDGQVFYTRNVSVFPTASYVSWTGVLGTSMLLGFASIDQSSGVYFALSLTEPSLPQLFVSDPTYLYPETISLSDVLYIPEHQLACNIFYNEDTEVYGSSCISVATADRGKTVFQFACSSDSGYPTLPLYDSNLGNVIFTCPVDSVVQAFHASTRTLAWTANVEVTFAVISGQSLVTAGSDETGNVSFAFVDLSSGAVVQNSTLQISAPSTSSYIDQFAMVDSTTGAVLLQNLGLYYVVVSTGEVKWFFNATGGLAFTSGVDPISASAAIFLYSYSSPSAFVGIDLSTGSTLFSVPAFVSSNNGNAVLTADFPPYLLLRQDPEGYTYAMSLAKRELLWFAESSSLPMLFNATFGELFVSSRYDGGIGAYLVSASGYASGAFYGNPTLIPDKPIPGYSILLTQTASGLYALDVTSGALNWGVMLSAESSSSSGPAAVTPVFPPIFVASTGPTIPDQVLFSIANLKVTSIALQSGAVQFSKYLPYCLGFGLGPSQSLSSSFGGIVDGQYVLITVGNQCLYSVNMETHDVSTASLPSLIATAAPPVVAGSCVVVADQFGSFFCFPRPSLSSKLSATATWQYQTGFSATVAQMQAVGSLFIIAHGNSIHCLSLSDNGRLVFRMDVGFNPVFSPAGNVLVVLTSSAVFGISLDPTASVRVLWQTTLSDLSAQATSTPALVVTYDGIAVVTVSTGFMGLQVFGPKAGSVVFNQTTDYSPNALAYAGNANSVFQRVIAVATDYLTLVADASTGETIFQLPVSDEYPTALVDSTTGALINTASNGYTTVNIMPAHYVSQVTSADPQTPAPTQPAPTGTLPPGFTPQGVFIGVPSLPPGVVLPKLGCILNVEALYNDLVTCVNAALSTVYTNSGVDNIQCAQAAALVEACAQSWITSTQRDCPASLVYLNNVLTTLNTSAAFNFCEKSDRCADGLLGSQAVCAAVETAQAAAGDATIYPGFSFPKPADQIPKFTIPSNTAPPGPPSPSGAPPAVENYAFTCLPKTAQSLRDIPKGFDALIQQLLNLAQTPELTYISGQNGGESFTFIFGTDTVAAILSSQLKNMIVNEYAQVLATLQLKGISFQQYSPAAPQEEGNGLGTPAIAGIAVGAAVFVIAAAVALYKYRSASSSAKFHVPLNASSGNYSSENMQSLPKMKLESVGTKYGAL